MTRQGSVLNWRWAEPEGAQEEQVQWLRLRCGGGKTEIRAVDDFSGACRSASAGPDLTDLGRWCGSVAPV